MEFNKNNELNKDSVRVHWGFNKDSIDPIESNRIQYIRRFSNKANKFNKKTNNVIKNNTSKVEEYKSGKEKLFGFFVGQVMKESKGKGNPQLINKILKEKLNG